VVTAAEQLPGLVRPERSAVLVVDMQNCFCDTSQPAVAAMMPRLRTFIEAARTVGVPLIFTQVVQTDETDTEVWQSLYERSPGFRNLCRAGTDDADYHDDFRPQPGDVTIVKHRYSAFVGTALEAVLRDRDISTVISTGLTTDCCVGTTAHDAFQFDFHSIVVSDCTAAATDEIQRSALSSHADAFGIVATADEIIAAWNTRS